MVPKLRNIVYMHVGPKMAPKFDFVYKINANYAYFYSQLLKLIIFDLLRFKKCLSQISVKKTTKTKVRKTKKYIRNSQNNKIHKKLILIPEVFSNTIAKNATKSI